MASRSRSPQRSSGSARLRIVGGELGGRVVSVPVHHTTVRPTSERLREALASALEARNAIRGRRVLDLFAGSGALAFEALSRGASSAVLVDDDARVRAAIVENARSLGLSDRVVVWLADLFDSRVGPPPGRPFDLVVCDPPYARVAELPALFAALAAKGAFADDVFVAIEHPAAGSPPLLASLAIERTYTHGSSACTLYAARASSGQRASPDGVPSLDR